MKLALVLVAAALAASSCGGGKPATSAAEVAPRATTLFVSGTLDDTARQALRLLPEGARLETRYELARESAGARSAAQVALIGRSAVAFAHPKDAKALDKQLDEAGLAHARVRGWTVFSRQAAAVELVRNAKRRLADAPWYHAPSGETTFVSRRATVEIAREDDRVVVTRTERGTRDREQPLAASIPSDAIAAASFRPEDLAGLPFAAELQAGLGLRVADVGAAAPAGGVLFARAGEPAPAVTLLGGGGTLAAARRIVASLDPAAPAPVPATLDGVPVADVPFGPIDLYYGVHKGTLAVTFDPETKLASPVKALAPPGLPAQTAAWAYLDVDRGVPGLDALAALAGTKLSAGFVGKVAPFRSVLAYRQRGGLVISVVPR